MTSRTYSIRLTANLRAQIDSGDPGILFSNLTILLASIVIELIAIFCENSPILRKFDLLYVCMYVCIDILEHSTISVAITAQSPYQVYSMQEHKSNTQFTQPRNSLQIYTQACISARHFSHSVRPTRVWL